MTKILVQRGISIRSATPTPLSSGCYNAVFLLWWLVLCVKCVLVHLPSHITSSSLLTQASTIHTCNRAHVHITGADHSPQDM